VISQTLDHRLAVLLRKADYGEANGATDGDRSERSEGEAVHGVTWWVCTL
jgi:hypothetical protein